MKKMEAYRWLQAQNQDLSFLANVILVDHTNPARKLKALVELVQAGHEFRIGNQIDILMMDGVQFSWAALDPGGPCIGCCRICDVWCGDKKRPDPSPVEEVRS